MIRIGHGYDAHRFVRGAKLVLGGVAIELDRGLAAHSDGDVLVHALCDALLGAAGLGDIGRHFPDSSSEFAGIDSRILLRRVVALIGARGFGVVNVDVTVIAQAPRLAPPSRRDAGEPRNPTCVSSPMASTSRRRLPRGWVSWGGARGSQRMRWR